MRNITHAVSSYNTVSRRVSFLAAEYAQGPRLSPLVPPCGLGFPQPVGVVSELMERRDNFSEQQRETPGNTSEAPIAKTTEIHHRGLPANFLLAGSANPMHIDRHSHGLQSPMIRELLGLPQLQSVGTKVEHLLSTLLLPDGPLKTPADDLTWQCGRGDKRTRRGKIFKESYGNARRTKKRESERLRRKWELPPGTPVKDIPTMSIE